MSRTHLFLLLLGLAAGCAPSLHLDDDDTVGDDDDDTPPPFRDGILYSGWFGECWGECRTDLGVSPDEGLVTLVTSGWENETYLDREGWLSGNGVLALDAAMGGVDPSDLDPVYGCPDCNDGGARQITWDLGPVAVSTQYEWGDPPPALEELDDVLRSMQDELETCNFGWFLSSVPDCEPVPGGGPTDG